MPASALIVAFAESAPEGLAMRLSHYAAAERLEVLGMLESDTAAAVASRLGRRELMEVPEEDFRRWLEDGEFDDAATLLGKLPRGEALARVEKVTDPGRRRRLQQFLHFPAHSLGSIASADVIRIPATANVTEVLAQLRDDTDGHQLPAVVVDDRNAVIGVLDLWQLFVRAQESSTVREFSHPVPTLRPEVSIVDAAAQPDWADHQWLPVVDYQQRLLGIVTRRQVLTAATAEGEAHPFSEGMVDLGNQFFTVSAEVLGELIGKGET